MADELDRVLERVRQNRSARARETRTMTTDATSRAPAAVATETAGARVFDTVTGQEGIVVGSTRENVIVPAAERRHG